MKKYIVFFVTITLFVSLIACDDDDYQSPKLEGKWTVTDQSVTLESEDKKLEQLLNTYFADDVKKTTVTWDIGLDEPEKIIVERTTGIKRRAYTYRTEASYIYMQESLDIMKVKYLTSRNILTLEQEVDKNTLGRILEDMQVAGSDILPANLKGVYKIMARR